MLKNITPYYLGLAPGFSAPRQAARLTDLLQANAFTPTQPTQELSAGWVAPDKYQPDLLAHDIGSELLCCLQIETRRVPAQAIAEHVEAAAQRIEADTGRKPGAKRRKELKDEARTTLLPRAFPRRKQINVWLSSKLGMLIIGSTSASDCDTVLTVLVRTIGAPEDSGISIQPLQTDIEPDLWMTSAVELQLAGAFDLLDTVIEMRDADPLGTTEAVTYQRVPIDTTELRDRAARMTVTKLALSYNDRVLFQLTDRLQLRKVELIGEPSQDAHQRADTGYGVDAFLWTAELTPALQALRDMLTDNTAQ